MIHLIPGDPVDAMLGESAARSDREAFRKTLGLTEPLSVQYALFFKRLLHGDLGSSLFERGPVLPIILNRLPATLELTLAAIGFAVLISFTLGTFAALKRNSLLDRMILAFSSLGLAVPNFWLGPTLVILFSIELGWLPVSGYGGVSHILLPALTLGTAMASILTRFLRSNLIQAMTDDYIKVARAKGLSESSIILKHALRNAMTSVITILGLQFGNLLAGSVITETIFNWPGMGRLMIQAIESRDYPLVQGCILLISTFYIGANLMTDLLYSLADPRVRYEN